MPKDTLNPRNYLAECREGVLVMLRKMKSHRVAGKLSVGLVSIGLLSSCSSTGSDLYSSQTPTVPSVLVSLALASDEMGNYPRAVNYYGQIISRGDASTQIWVRRGELLLKLGAVKNAKAHYEAALDASIDSAEIRRGYGRSLARTNQPEKALRQFDITLRMTPDSVKAMNGRGVALDMLGRHEEAQTQYAKAQELAPSDLSVQNNLALSYTLAGNAHSAITMLEDVYLSGRSTMQHRQNLALLYGLTGQNEKATALSNIDLRPELVGKNLVAYATLREKYKQSAITDRKTPAKAEVASINQSPASTAPASTASVSKASTSNQVILPPLAGKVETPLPVPYDAYVDPAPMSVVKLLQPESNALKALPVDVDVVFLPFDVEAAKPQAEEIAHVARVAPVSTEAAEIDSSIAPAFVALETTDANIGQGPIVEKIRIANLPLAVKMPEISTITLSDEPTVSAIRPTIQTTKMFDDGLTVRKQQPKFVSVARNTRTASAERSYDTLADLEFAAMQADLDAFGNPLHIKPSVSMRRRTPILEPVAEVSHSSASAGASEPWLLKLGVYSTQDQANGAWMKLSKKHGPALAGMVHYLEQAETGSLLVVGPVANRGLAISLCARLVPGAGMCNAEAVWSASAKAEIEVKFGHIAM